MFNQATLPPLPLDRRILKQMESNMNKYKNGHTDRPSFQDYLNEIIYRLEEELTPENDQMRHSWERLADDLQDLSIPFPVDHIRTSYGLLYDYRQYLLELLKAYKEEIIARKIDAN